MANKPKFTNGAIMRAIRGDDKSPFVMPTEESPGDNIWIDDPRKSSYGHIPTIAKRLGCTEQTVRNYMSRTDKDGNLTKLAVIMRDSIAEEKAIGEKHRSDFHHELIRDAEKSLALHVKMLDFNATKFALERLDKGNYSARSEMTGADGQPLFDNETLRLMDELGIDRNEAIRQTVNAIKQQLINAANKTSSMERGDE